MKWLITLLGCVLSACSATPRPAPEPVVQTKLVNVAVATPCKALQDLGPEPAYADTDAAIQAAPDIFALAKLYATGRLQRIDRLAKYVEAKASCL